MLKAGRKNRKEVSRNATPSSPWTQESINLAEDDVSLDTYAPLERPIGSKAEKGRLKKVKSHGCSSSQIRELLNEMLEERKRVFKMQVEMFVKLYLNQAEEIRIERLRDEHRIMMLDSSGMSPMLQEYYRLCKKEVIDGQKKQ